MILQLLPVDLPIPKASLAVTCIVTKGLNRVWLFLFFKSVLDISANYTFIKDNTTDVLVHCILSLDPLFLTVGEFQALA